MSLLTSLPIMPKENKIPTMSHSTPTATPYPSSSSSAQKNGAMWSTSDDEILLQARASGLNWQVMAKTHFPSKTANACRKRHERLIEKRHVEDWDTNKLEFLAQEYVACRREMWEILAAKLDERWPVVEAKCMEKGSKNLQTIARTAARKAAADSVSVHDRGIFDQTSDSGIGLGSDAEMEVERETTSSDETSNWTTHSAPQQAYQEHVRSRSLPQPIPLYQPPPPLAPASRTVEHTSYASRSNNTVADAPLPSRRYSPESQNGRGGLSIQSVLSD